MLGYFGHVTGNKGNIFYMQFYGDPRTLLTLVDAEFMRTITDEMAAADKRFLERLN